MVVPIDECATGSPNVGRVRNAGLCMGCGTCESVCPEEAIEVRRDDRKGVYFPVVDPERCTECGLCLDVCPGESVNIEQLAYEFLDGQAKDKMLGTFHECYVGHASAQDIRYNSTSGGLVTSLLIQAMENSLIDGALVLGMSESNPLETKPFVATTPSQVISASGSKYCPSATNVGLRHILYNEGLFAVVGLPCHMHAIRTLERLDEALRKKIALHLGLFCANNNTYLGTQYFLRQNGIHPEDVLEIRYRGEGWPGKICVTMRDGARKIIPRATTEKRWWRRAWFSSAFHYDFMIPRCLSCPDQTCELADIAFGDPWLQKIKQHERIGKSLVIVRSRIGRKFLAEAREAGAVVLEEVPVHLVKRAQNYAYKAGVGGRIRLCQALGLATPEYSERDLTYRKRDIILAFRYLPSYFSHHRWLWPLLRCFAVIDYGGRLVIWRKAKSVLRFCLRRFASSNHS